MVSNAELLGRLAEEAALNLDETGHKDRGELRWTWCFRAELYTLFKIDPTRSAEVLLEVPGAEFDWVLGCDCFSAHRRYVRECDVRVQFCLAHRIRMVKFLCTLPDAATRRYGERLGEALRRRLGLIHRRDEFTRAAFRQRLGEARTDVLFWASDQVPVSQAARRLAGRLAKYGAVYFVFVTEPGIAPTNHVAEQAIRFVVFDRHITQGTRGETGQRFCERTWTVLATCGQLGRSVFAYLTAAVGAYFQEEEAPGLLPGESGAAGPKPGLFAVARSPGLGRLRGRPRAAAEAGKQQWPAAPSQARAKDRSCQPGVKASAEFAHARLSLPHI
jgi:hypothetical protein